MDNGRKKIIETMPHIRNCLSNPLTKRIVFVFLGFVWAYVYWHELNHNPMYKDRTGIQYIYYVSIPVIALLLHALLQWRLSWLIVNIIYVTGWSLHLYREFHYNYFKSVTDNTFSGIIEICSYYLLILLFGLFVFYYFRPLRQLKLK